MTRTESSELAGEKPVGVGGVSLSATVTLSRLDVDGNPIDSCLEKVMILWVKLRFHTKRQFCVRKGGTYLETNEIDFLVVFHNTTSNWNLILLIKFTYGILVYYTFAAVLGYWFAR